MTDRTVITCPCGLAHTLLDWMQLKYVGCHVDRDKRLELRNCTCHSTISIEQPTGILANCSCKAQYSIEHWLELPLIIARKDLPHEVVQYRKCVGDDCNRTLFLVFNLETGRAKENLQHETRTKEEQDQARAERA